VSELRELLEREARRIEAKPDALASTIRRVDRRRAIRRAATITVALAVAVIAIGSTLSVFRTAVRPRPAQHGITPDEARRLTLEWRAPLQGHVSPPVVVGGSVYVWSGATGRLERVTATCATGGSSCRPRGSQALGRFVGHTGMTVADGVLYIATHDGQLAAYPCPNECASDPMWTARVSGRLSQPTVAGGVVYTTGLVHKDEHATVYAFGAECSSGGGRCRPLWIGRGPVGGSFAPVVDHGFVFVGHAQGPLYAFPVGCATGGRSCDPAWVGVPGLDLSFTSWPVPVGDLDVILTDRGVLALDPACFSSKACVPVWRTSHLNGIAFASGGPRYYVATIEGDVLGFDADCGTGGALCSPSWSARLPGGEPANFGSLLVRDGVVYVGTSTGKVFAFDAACTDACAPLWSKTIGRGHVGLAVVGEAVYATARGTVEAFRPAPS
jgi:outer membrane protein assembly factor BamB